MPKLITQQDATEEKGRGLLAIRVADVCKNVPYDGKMACFDGMLLITNQNKEPDGRSIQYQLKSTEDADCFDWSIKIEEMKVYPKYPHPCIIIIVNIPSERIYWQLIDSYYLNHFVNLESKTHSIKFSSAQGIDDKGNFIDDIYAKYTNQNKGEEVFLQQLRKIKDSDRSSTTEERSNISDRIDLMAEQQKHKIKLFITCVYLSEPLYMDDRGLEMRNKIRAIVNCNAIEELSIVNVLIANEIIKSEGAIIALNDRAGAKEIANEMIEHNDKILDEFL